MSEYEKSIEDLGCGYKLVLEDTRDYTTRATLIYPDGDEDCLVGGYEHEAPEDMTRDALLRAYSTQPFVQAR